MPQILIRSHKNPFTVADADTTYRQNLIGNNTGNLVFSQAVFGCCQPPATMWRPQGSPESHPGLSTRASTTSSSRSPTPSGPLYRDAAMR